MLYKVYTQYKNGAVGTTYSNGKKEAIFKSFLEMLSNKDLWLTAEAVVIDAPRGEVYRYELNAKTPVPEFGDIPWPRRGRALTLDHGRTISAFVSSDDVEFVRKRGGGNLSRGLRNMVNELKVMEAQ